MNFHRHLFILITLLLVVGCSRTELLYDNADWLAHRWTSRMVDASEAQKEAWREPFRQALLEHRRQLLPEVIVLLRMLEVQAESGLHADQLSCWVAAVDRVYRDHAAMLVPLATMVLLDISPTQVAHLAEEMEQGNRDYREDYLDEDLALRRRERIARFIERIERWTGDLSTVQLAVAEKAVLAMPDTAEDWLVYRRQQQQGLLALLREGPDAQVLRQFLDHWWMDFAARPPALSSKVQRLHADGIALALELDMMLSDEQREAFVDNIRDVRDGLERALDSPMSLRRAQRHAEPCVDTRQVLN